MPKDWGEWHKAYDGETPLARRLEIVQARIASALSGMPPGPIRVLSMCAGEGRDLLGVLGSHARRQDVRGRLVELDERLAATARAHAPSGVEVVCGDASLLDAYAGATPADLVLVCGVFGNVEDVDIARTIALLPSLCAPGATVIWTRHRRDPDLTPTIRGWFAQTGFDEVSWYAPDDFLFGVGVHRFARSPRMFRFVGYDALDPGTTQA